MKKFVIYDEIKNGDCFDRVVEVENMEEAIHEVENEWEQMSEYDKSRRVAFFLAKTDIDEDGCPDWNTAKMIAKIK